MAKKGVTLTTLAITIIVITLIAGVVIVNATGIVEKTELAKFGEEIKKIEDAYREYYALSGNAPTLNEEQYTAEQIIALNTLGYGEKLQREIEKNGDTNSIFCLIDFEEIGLNIDKRGIRATNDDIYVVSLVTNRVYYLKGVEIADDVYFSTAYIVETTSIL